MNKTESILRTFTASEWKQFLAFAAMGGDDAPLCRLAKLYHAVEAEHSAPNREAIHREIFPGEPFDDLRIRHLQSDLLKSAEKFLLLQEITRDPIRADLLLMDVYRERKLHKHYHYTSRRIRKSIREASERNSDFYLHQYKLEELENRMVEERKIRSAELNLQAAADALDHYYLIHKLKYICAIQNNRHVVNQDYELLLEGEIIDNIRKNDYSDVPAIGIYFRIYEMLTDFEQETHFRELILLLEKHRTLFRDDELRELYAFAQNYCIRKINAGKPEYLEALFDLYLRVLDAGIIFVKNEISPWDFKNIVTLALRLKHFEWVRKFIADNEKYLDEDFRENAFAYNLARLEYEEGNFRKVLQLLQQVRYDDLFYSLDSRTLLLKTYFELKEADALDSLIDSFRVFLHRNRQISDQHKKNYLNLLRYVKRLVRIPDYDRQRLKKLQRQVSLAEHVADGNWLRSRLQRKLEGS